MGSDSRFTIHDSPSSTFKVLVTGESMWPTLVPGKRYLARRDVEPQVGDIVVATHPSNPSQTIVKRIAEIINHESSIMNYRLVGTVSWSSIFAVTRPQILGVIDQ